MRKSLLIIDDSELDRAIFNEIFKKITAFSAPLPPMRGLTRCARMCRIWPW